MRDAVVSPLSPSVPRCADRSGSRFATIGTFRACRVLLDGYLDARFAFDTGIGINLVSKSLCKMLECESAGQYVGKRMSGQEVTGPLARVRSLAVGQSNPTSSSESSTSRASWMRRTSRASWRSDSSHVAPSRSTSERASSCSKDEASLARRVATGTVVNVDLRREGESLTVFLALQQREGRLVDVVVELKRRTNRPAPRASSTCERTSQRQISSCPTTR